MCNQTRARILGGIMMNILLNIIFTILIVPFAIVIGIFLGALYMPGMVICSIWEGSTEEDA